jgi:DivIVA domain-containing protein
VALERQSIEKKDFPFGLRGYDPEAVDAHLSSLADEVEELKASSRRRTETVASAAGDQVRAIVDAAEKSAAELQRQAEEDARDTRAEAAADAQSTREQATAQAREYVGKVSESTSVMLQRLDAMESELTTLIDALRAGANRLSADLQLLDANLSDVAKTAGPRPPFEPEVRTAREAAEPRAAVAEVTVEESGAERAVAAPTATDAAAAAPTAFDAAVAAPTATDAAAAAPTATDAAAAPPTATGTAEGDADTEGARLIALNMALNGTARDETDRYLAENYTLGDRGRLLDEVYASVEG